MKKFNFGLKKDNCNENKVEKMTYEEVLKKIDDMNNEKPKDISEFVLPKELLGYAEIVGNALVKINEMDTKTYIIYSQLEKEIRYNFYRQDNIDLGSWCGRGYVTGNNRYIVDLTDLKVYNTISIVNDDNVMAESMNLIENSNLTKNQSNKLFVLIMEQNQHLKITLEKEITQEEKKDIIILLIEELSKNYQNGMSFDFGTNVKIQINGKSMELQNCHSNYKEAKLYEKLLIKISKKNEIKYKDLVISNNENEVLKQMSYEELSKKLEELLIKN